MAACEVGGRSIDGAFGRSRTGWVGYLVVWEPGYSRAREGAHLPVQCVCVARPSLPGCG
jgi:hypothetical protein